MIKQGYDIIGDIHGHADELMELFERLGYDRQQGFYAHPDRKAVFVGDFIDRGPKIAEVLQTVRPMIDAGKAYAVMGNHEFNAIAYHTRDPATDGGFLRNHNKKNTHQHAETMRQLSAEELDDAVEWFRSLPMWIELDGIRVVHACWEPESNEIIRGSIREPSRASTRFMESATQEETPLYLAVEDVLKGKELALPEGVTFKDSDGHERTEVRIRWLTLPDERVHVS